jgi:hypothetical protein
VRPDVLAGVRHPTEAKDTLRTMSAWPRLNVSYRSARMALTGREWQLGDTSTPVTGTEGAYHELALAAFKEPR